MQCNAIQYNTVQYSTVQCNAMQSNTIQYSTRTMQCNIMLCSKVQYRCNAMHFYHLCYLLSQVLRRLLFFRWECRSGILRHNLLQNNTMQILLVSNCLFIYFFSFIKMYHFQFNSGIYPFIYHSFLAETVETLHLFSILQLLKSLPFYIPEA